MALLLAASTVCSLSAGPYLEKKEAETLKAAGGLADPRALCEALAPLASDCARFLDANRPFPVKPADIYAMPASSEARAFSLNPATVRAPELSESAAAGIAQARSYFDARGSRCGYLLVDLETGRGVGGGYDELVYGASTFKGILCAYLCEELVDEGAVAQSRVNGLVTSTIVSSSNDAYRSLYNAYAHSGEGLSAWVADLGVGTENVCRFRFPTYSARESAALWAHIADYLESGGESAAWLSSLYEQTNVSHIRAAVERGVNEGDLACEGDWRVMNKAGWIAGSTNSTSDAGIVEINGRRYVMSIMTSAPDCDASREACTQLALALLQAAQGI